MIIWKLGRRHETLLNFVQINFFLSTFASSHTTDSVRKWIFIHIEMTVFKSLLCD